MCDNFLNHTLILRGGRIIRHVVLLLVNVSAFYFFIVSHEFVCVLCCVELCVVFVVSVDSFTLLLLLFFCVFCYEAGLCRPSCLATQAPVSSKDLIFP